MCRLCHLMYVRNNIVVKSSIAYKECYLEVKIVN